MKVYLEENCWVKFATTDGRIKIGRVEKLYDDKPFSSQNFWVFVPQEGHYQVDLDSIIKVYPKVYIKPVHELAYQLTKEPKK